VLVMPHISQPHPPPQPSSRTIQKDSWNSADGDEAGGQAASVISRSSGNDQKQRAKDPGNSRRPRSSRASGRPSPPSINGGVKPRKSGECRFVGCGWYRRRGPERGACGRGERHAELLRLPVGEEIPQCEDLASADREVAVAAKQHCRQSGNPPCDPEAICQPVAQAWVRRHRAKIRPSKPGPVRRARPNPAQRRQRQRGETEHLAPGRVLAYPGFHGCLRTVELRPDPSRTLGRGVRFSGFQTQVPWFD
jgi:hypothetical protein